MAAVAKVNLVILWEDELRTAARLLREAHDEPDDAKADDLARTAYAACLNALWGLNDDSAVVVANKDIRRATVQPEEGQTK